MKILHIWFNKLSSKNAKDFLSYIEMQMLDDKYEHHLIINKEVYDCHSDILKFFKEYHKNRLHRVHTFGSFFPRFSHIPKYDLLIAHDNKSNLWSYKLHLSQHFPYIYIPYSDKDISIYSSINKLPLRKNSHVVLPSFFERNIFASTLDMSINLSGKISVIPTNKFALDSQQISLLRQKYTKEYVYNTLKENDNKLRIGVYLSSNGNSNTLEATSLYFINKLLKDFDGKINIKLGIDHNCLNKYKQLATSKAIVKKDLELVLNIIKATLSNNRANLNFEDIVNNSDLYFETNYDDLNTHNRILKAQSNGLVSIIFNDLYNIDLSNNTYDHNINPSAITLKLKLCENNIGNIYNENNNLNAQFSESNTPINLYACEFTNAYLGVIKNKEHEDIDVAMYKAIISQLYHTCFDECYEALKNTFNEMLSTPDVYIKLKQENIEFMINKFDETKIINQLNQIYNKTVTPLKS